MLACIQKTIENITYYGFIFVAMRGENFCRACGSTFVFIIKYAQTPINKTVVSLTLTLTLTPTQVRAGRVQGTTPLAHAATARRHLPSAAAAAEYAP